MQDSRPALVQAALQALVSICQLAGAQFMTRRVQAEGWPIILQLMKHGFPEQRPSTYPSGNLTQLTAHCRCTAYWQQAFRGDPNLLVDCLMQMVYLQSCRLLLYACCAEGISCMLWHNFQDCRTADRRQLTCLCGATWAQSRLTTMRSLLDNDSIHSAITQPAAFVSL